MSALSKADMYGALAGSANSGHWKAARLTDKLISLNKFYGKLRRSESTRALQGQHVHTIERWTMYRHILVPTDGSDVARKGLQQGIALAKALNAKATVITVTEMLPVYYGGDIAAGWIPPQEMFDSFDAVCKERAGKVLDEARAMAKQIGIPVDVLHVPNAHPATAIIETAKSGGCDLIVMASHGRRGLRKLFLGSQTSEVLANGSVPVLVVW